MRISEFLFLILIEKTCGRGGRGGGGRGASGARSGVGLGVSSGFFTSQSYGYKASNSYNGMNYHYFYSPIYVGHGIRRSQSESGVFCEYTPYENDVDKKLNISDIVMEEDYLMGNTTSLHSTIPKKIGFYCDGFGAECCHLDCCTSRFYSFFLDVIYFSIHFLWVVLVFVGIILCVRWGTIIDNKCRKKPEGNAPVNGEELRPFCEADRENGVTPLTA